MANGSAALLALSAPGGAARSEKPVMAAPEAWELATRPSGSRLAPVQEDAQQNEAYAHVQRRVGQVEYPYEADLGRVEKIHYRSHEEPVESVADRAGHDQSEPIDGERPGTAPQDDEQEERGDGEVCAHQEPSGRITDDRRESESIALVEIERQIDGPGQLQMPPDLTQCRQGPSLGDLVCRNGKRREKQCKGFIPAEHSGS